MRIRYIINIAFHLSEKRVGYLINDASTNSYPTEIK